MTKEEFEVIYAGCNRKWVGMLVRLDFDQDTAQDIVQDLAVEVLSDLDKFTGTNLKSYLTRRVKLKAMEAKRSSYNRSNKHVSFTGMLESEEPSFTPDYDTLLDVNTALDELAAHDREFMVILADNDYNVSKAAKELGMPLTSAQRIWSRLKDSLAGKLEAYNV